MISQKLMLMFTLHLTELLLIDKKNNIDQFHTLVLKEN